MGLFKRNVKQESGQAASPSDVATVRAKLATVEQEIAAAEGRLRQASLAAALSDDTSAADHAAGELQALRSRKEILLNALAEAERLETERLAAVRATENLARKRALS